MAESQPETRIPMLLVHQWLSNWENIPLTGSDFRDEPNKEFFLFSAPISVLKRLTGINRRERPDASSPSKETAVQRRHVSERSLEILRFLKVGFPLSKLSPARAQKELSTLQMPGWLPTAILVNMTREATEFGSKTKDNKIVIEKPEHGNISYLHLPNNLSDPGWVPENDPFQIIDGQHRLWAIDDETKRIHGEELPEGLDEYEVPVVAFYNLAPTWQAYLFYTINQLPKRINTSLAFDLYPLLRTQEWLLRYEGPEIYRETRAQEIVTDLWEHPKSVWLGRILRFGGRKRGYVTQASFIRGLLHSFIKTFEPTGRAKIGGLFGSRRGDKRPVLNWDKDQQSAFILLIWTQFFNAVKSTSAEWATCLRAIQSDIPDPDLESIRELLDRSLEGIDQHDMKRPNQPVLKEVAFSGPSSLIATDQGVRGYSIIVNDLLWVAYEDGTIDFDKWSISPLVDYGAAAISEGIKTFPKQAPLAHQLITDIANSLAEFDWRLEKAIPAGHPLLERQAGFLGSGGYRRLREALLEHLRESGDERVKNLILNWADQLRLSSKESGSN